MKKAELRKAISDCWIEARELNAAETHEVVSAVYRYASEADLTPSLVKHVGLSEHAGEDEFLGRYWVGDGLDARCALEDFVSWGPARDEIADHLGCNSSRPQL